MRALLAAAVAIGVSGGALSQAPADFSGRWAIDTAPPAPPPGVAAAPAGRPDHGTLARGDMSSGWGSPLTITQDARQLVVEQTLFSRYDINPQPRFVYALDGSETRNTAMIGHATQLRTSRATWDGQSLRIVTRYPGIDPGTGKPFTIDVMVIETTRAAVLGGKENTTRSIYRKG